MSFNKEVFAKISDDHKYSDMTIVSLTDERAENPYQ